MTGAAATPLVTIVPANEASWADLQTVLGFARQRGARALEGYPMITRPGQEITWDELHVGGRRIFAAAGFAEVSRRNGRVVTLVRPI